MIPITLARALAFAEGTSHGAPERLDTDTAHHLMRVHINCRAWRCPCKASALMLLVDQGRIRPDYYRYDL